MGKSEVLFMQDQYSKCHMLISEAYLCCYFHHIFTKKMFLLIASHPCTPEYQKSLQTIYLILFYYYYFQYMQKYLLSQSAMSKP